jgi:hypothetical protein
MQHSVPSITALEQSWAKIPTAMLTKCTDINHKGAAMLCQQ